MSFDFRLTALRVPYHPGGVITAPVYIGKIADAGLFAYNWNGNRVISGQLGYSLLIGGQGLSPNFVSYHGYCYFQSSNYTIWHGPVSDNGSTSVQWILSEASISIGQVPIEYWQYNSGPSGPGNYRGSQFYTGSIPSLGGSVVWQGRGVLRGSTLGGYGSNQYTVSTQWAYWKPESGQLGKFDPFGTATGNKYFGLPQWKDQNNTVYLRSVYQTSGHYAYGAATYNATHSLWIIGTYGNPTGWLQSSTEPSLSASVDFTPAYPVGYTPPDPPDLVTLTLTFDSYVVATNKDSIFVLKSGIWRQST